MQLNTLEYGDELADSDSFNLSPMSRQLSELPQLMRLFQGKKIVAFLGKTGSGKSTTVNYLLGSNYKSLFMGRCELFGDISESAHTSDGATSDTRLPAIYQLPNSDICFADFPGFDDNRSVETQALISIATETALKAATIHALAIVIDASGFRSPRDGIIRRIFEILAEIFANNMLKKVMTQSTYLIFTKEEKLSCQHVKEELLGLKEHLSSYSPNSSSLIVIDSILQHITERVFIINFEDDNRNLIRNSLFNCKTSIPAIAFNFMKYDTARKQLHRALSLEMIKAVHYLDGYNSLNLEIEALLVTISSEQNSLEHKKATLQRARQERQALAVEQEELTSKLPEIITMLDRIEQKSNEIDEKLLELDAKLKELDVTDECELYDQRSCRPLPVNDSYFTAFRRRYFGTYEQIEYTCPMPIYTAIPQSDYLEDSFDNEFYSNDRHYYSIIYYSPNSNQAAKVDIFVAKRHFYHTQIQKLIDKINHKKNFLTKLKQEKTECVIDKTMVVKRRVESQQQILHLDSDIEKLMIEIDSLGNQIQLKLSNFSNRKKLLKKIISELTVHNDLYNTVLSVCFILNYDIGLARNFESQFLKYNNDSKTSVHYLLGFIKHKFLSFRNYFVNTASVCSVPKLLQLYTPQLQDEIDKLSLELQDANMRIQDLCSKRDEMNESIIDLDTNDLIRVDEIEIHVSSSELSWLQFIKKRLWGLCHSKRFNSQIPLEEVRINSEINGCFMKVQFSHDRLSCIIEFKVDRNAPQSSGNITFFAKSSDYHQVKINQIKSRHDELFTVLDEEEKKKMGLLDSLEFKKWCQQKFNSSDSHYSEVTSFRKMIALIGRMGFSSQSINNPIDPVTSTTRSAALRI